MLDWRAGKEVCSIQQMPGSVDHYPPPSSASAKARAKAKTRKNSAKVD
jgi:hypothetical protein